MAKRSADTERIGDEDDFRSTAPSVEPQTQRATAAQLAARNPYAKKLLNRTVPYKRRIRMAKPRQNRRPGVQARPLTPQASPLSQSFPAPSWGTNTSAASAGTQQPSSGFTFGQQPGSFASSSNPNASFASFGGQNNNFNQQSTAPSSTGFNFAAPPTSNPFAGMNQQSQPQPPTVTSGFSGSIFSLPPQTPAAPKPSIERPPTEMRTPRHWMKNLSEANQERDPQSFFVPHAPFKWGQPDAPQQEQSQQAASNSDASAASQQVAQPPSDHHFTQNSQQQQPTSNVFAHLQQPSSSSSNPFALQPPQQPQTTGIFGQHLASSLSQPSQPASSFFGQPSASQDQSPTNIFGKPATSPTKDEDSMSTTPDTSPQASNERTRSGPFASISAPSMDALANGAAPAGPPSSSIFGSSFQPPGGGRLTNGETPKEPASGEGLQSNDNDQASNASLGSPTKKSRTIAQSSTEHSHVEEETPVKKDNPFSAIKFPAPNPQSAPPPFSLSPSPIPSQKAALASPQPNGNALSLSAKSTATEGSSAKQSRGSREPGMPPQAPAEFTEEQKRQLITGWRLKSLDVGMQSYLRYSTFDQEEIESVKAFYELRKRAILDANGGPLPEIGNKRAAEGQAGLRTKKARHGQSSTTVEGQIQSINQFSAGKSSPGKRKAGGDLHEQDHDTSSNGLKRSKTNDPVTYPSLPTSSTNSQTSKLFGNLVGKKSIETSPGNSNPTVNGHLSTESAPKDTVQSSNASSSQLDLLFKPPASSSGASERPVSPNKGKQVSSFGSGEEPASTPLQSKTGNLDTSNQATSTQRGTPFKGFVPSPAKISNNSIPFNGFFSSQRSQDDSATKASSNTPTIAQEPSSAQPASNTSSFSGFSAGATKNLNAKRKADDSDDGEDDGDQANPQKSEEQRSKKQKAGDGPIDLTPGDKRNDSIFKTQPIGGLAGFYQSVLARPSPLPTNTSNMFGHLAQSTEQHNDDTQAPEDDEDTGESQQPMAQQSGSSNANQTLKVANSGPSRSVSPVYNPFASATFDTPPNKAAETQKPQGRSIFDRIETDDKGQPIKAPNFGNSILKTPTGQKIGSFLDPAKPTGSSPFGVSTLSAGNDIFGNRSNEAGKEKSPANQNSNIFGTPSSSNNAPMANMFGGKGTGNSPGGDNTWKPQTPIKFGEVSSAEAPSISFTSPSPAKTTFTGLFGAPKATTSSETSGSSIFKPTDSPFGKPAPLTFGFSAPAKETNESLALPSGTQSESTSRATSPGGTDTEGVGESSDAVHDQETTPQLDSAEASKAEADEDVVFEEMGKLYKFDNSGKDKSTHKWVLQGTEQFRVLKHRDTNKTRMLMRLKNGRIILNAGLQNSLSYAHVPAKRVRFPVPADGKVETWMLSLGQDDDAKKLTGILEENKDY
ncbi:MAG: hypothetical protein LQ345_001945 [Seirophora villosa]|nr:MAG: hypothetical protein LQ345_001945 [Seirophora villosa]